MLAMRKKKRVDILPVEASKSTVCSRGDRAHSLLLDSEILLRAMINQLIHVHILALPPPPDRLMQGAHSQNKKKKQENIPKEVKDYHKLGMKHARRFVHFSCS